MLSYSDNTGIIIGVTKRLIMNGFILLLRYYPPMGGIIGVSCGGYENRTYTGNWSLKSA